MPNSRTNKHILSGMLIIEKTKERINILNVCKPILFYIWCTILNKRDQLQIKHFDNFVDTITVIKFFLLEADFDISQFKFALAPSVTAHYAVHVPWGTMATLNIAVCKFVIPVQWEWDHKQRIFLVDCIFFHLQSRQCALLLFVLCIHGRNVYLSIEP